MKIGEEVGEEGSKEEGRKEGGRTTVIKSNNRHLAGGEKRTCEQPIFHFSRDTGTGTAEDLEANTGKPSERSQHIIVGSIRRGSRVAIHSMW